MPETGFGLFGTRDGEREMLNWSPKREMMEAVESLGLYQGQGYTDLAIEESDGEDSPHAQSLQMARENAAKGRPLKKARKQALVKRQAMHPDTRFVTWAEFKSAAEAQGLADTDPVSSIGCNFPVELEGEPELLVIRDELGIVAIQFDPTNEAE